MKKASTKPIIAVDIDDVISDYVSSVVQFVRREYNENFTHDDVLENWSEMLGIPQDEWVRQYESFVFEDKYYENPPIIEGAVEALQRLSTSFDLVALTSRSSFLRDATIKFIDDNLPNLFKEVVLAGIWEPNKDGVVNANALARHTKADVCREIGANYLIDDQPKHCNGAAQIGIKGLLFGDYGWNRTVEIENLVTRVSDWRAVEKYFEAQCE